MKNFAADMDGLRLLVIDEVSMVSRVILAGVDQRLKEGRSCDFHSISNDFHCFSTISIDFQRISPIFGVQKSPGSVRGFQRVSGGSGAVFGGPEAKNSYIYTMDLGAICMDW